MKMTIKILKKKFKSYNPKIKEECGVFGISNNVDASTLTALGLHALQHRGQEGCGIVSFDGKKYHSEKRFGLVGDNFNKEKVLKSLPGNYAIGHNRYSTTGGTTLRNIQPFFADTNTGGIGVSHNGNLTNAITLRKKLVEDGAIFYTTSDTETIVQLIARSKRLKTIDKIVDALFQIQGGYALVMLTQNTLIGVRDPFGIRPLVIGQLNNWTMLDIAQSFIFYAICGIGGSLVSGLLVDKFSGRSVITFHLIPMALIFIVMLFSNHIFVLYLYMAGLGLSNGFTENMSNSLWAEMYGVKNLGAIRALLTFFGVLASAASPFLYGLILDETNSINTLIYMSLALIIIFSSLSFIGNKIK